MCPSTRPQPDRYTGLSSSAPLNRYTVSVRALCEFAAKAGDLDRRFTPSPTSQQGIAGHRSVAARRSGSHRCEVPAEGAYEELVVRGRADGFDLERGWLEEVKTFSGDLDRIPDNHRALRFFQGLGARQTRASGGVCTLILER